MNKQPYEIVDVAQGSEAWLKMRREKITATDTAKILGLDKKCTPFKLWHQKFEMCEATFVTEKMKEGSRLEPLARDYYNKQTKGDYAPAVIISKEFPWMMASLDGLNSQGHIMEIKCGKAAYEMIQEAVISDMYIAQMQKQMLVSGQDHVLYVCYLSDHECEEMIVERDEEYIEKIIAKESEFYEYVRTLTPPPLESGDYSLMSGKEWNIISSIYKETDREIKQLEAKKKDLKDQLVLMTNGLPSKGNGLTLMKTYKAGVVQYKDIPELLGVDLEKYRGEPSQFWTIREEKNGGHNE